jgi:hypothetical protein
MDESKGAAVALPSEAAQARVGPKQLVHEHVPRFLKLLPEVLSGERAEAVHDLRVWSRRRQQYWSQSFLERRAIELTR